MAFFGIIEFMVNSELSTPSSPARHASRVEAGGSPPYPPNSAGRQGGERGTEAPHEGENGNKKSLAKKELISIAFQLGFIIAIPVVVFGFFGKWLDGKAGTYPLLSLIGIFTAIIFTGIWIYRKFKEYFKSTPSSSPPYQGGEKREGGHSL